MVPGAQAVAVGAGLSGGPIGHRRAGGVGEAARGMGAATGAVRRALRGRLGPDGVAAARVAGLGRPTALQVWQRGQHGAHAGRGNVDGRASRGVHEAARRSVVRRGALGGRDGQGLVHLLGLLGAEGAQLGAAAGPDQLVGLV